MKNLALAILAACLCCGCVNVCATRNPFCSLEVEQCYQSSSMAAGCAVICAFPQMMSDNPRNSGSFMWENIFTIPLGCMVLCDAACEAAIDTVLLPIDWPLSSYRKRKEKSK